MSNWKSQTKPSRQIFIVILSKSLGTMFRNWICDYFFHSQFPLRNFFFWQCPNFYFICSVAKNCLSFEAEIKSPKLHFFFFLPQDLITHSHLPMSCKVLLFTTMDSWAEILLKYHNQFLRQGAIRKMPWFSGDYNTYFMWNIVGYSVIIL